MTAFAISAEGTHTTLPSTVSVVEVGPRDGLQNERAPVATEDKVRLIDHLSCTGVRRIEATSFVSPRAVPQMADAAEVMAAITRAPGVEYAALVANLRGAERALAARVDLFNVVVVASETFNQRNAKMSVAESVQGVREIVAIGHAARLPVSAVVAASFGCPFEGEVPPVRVLELVAQLVDAGVDEVTLADTIGVANPAQVSRLVADVRTRWPELSLGLHLHDTRGCGLANALAGLLAGVARFDASVGGLGGCPFAPGATGNIVTEDLANLMHEMLVATGIDMPSMLVAAQVAQDAVKRPLASHMLKLAPAAAVAPDREVFVAP